MRKVNLKNLRVNGNRVPQGVWDRVAEILLPGREPSEADKRHGKSKSAVLKRIVATDAAMRKQSLKLSAELMSADAKAEAAASGWLPKSAADLPKLPNGEVAPCSEFPNGLHADGRDYVALVAELKAHMSPRAAIMLCGVCGARLHLRQREGLTDGNKPAPKLNRLLVFYTLCEPLRGAKHMSSQPLSHQPEKLGSPYCADPECEYCKELREAEEEIKQATASEKKA